MSFDQISSSVGCDLASRNWLKVALDPFHDFNVPISGIPDNDSQSSAVQVIPKVVTISAPANLAVGETWSAHFSTLPTASTQNARSCIRDQTLGLAGEGAVRLTDGGQQAQLGTITVVTHGDDPRANLSSNTSYPSLTGGTPSTRVTYADSYSSTSREFYAHSLDDNNEKTMKKLIGGGFEVHNDTAALYKQGSVTVYSSGNSVTEEVAESANGTVSATYLHQAIRKCRQPPSDKAEAGSMPDSRTFEAAEGVYVPIRLGDDTHYAINKRAVFLTQSSDSTDTTLDTPQGYATVWSTAASGITQNYQVTHRPLDIETTGAYFSGLSPETTLTLSIKFLVELCPTAANPSMLYMASPTAMYCPRALELYHQTVRSLPPGVPVNFNDKGDWFRMATKVVSEVAPLIAPFLGAINPGLATAAGLVGSVAGVTNQAITKKKKEPPPTSKSTAPRSMSKALSRPNVGRNSRK